MAVQINKNNFAYVSIVLSRSVMSDSLRPHGLQPVRLLFCPWDSPGKNTEVGCHALLQRIFPTQGSNPGLLHCRRILYQPSHQGRPKKVLKCVWKCATAHIMILGVSKATSLRAPWFVCLSAIDLEMCRSSPAVGNTRDRWPQVLCSESTTTVSCQNHTAIVCQFSLNSNCLPLAHD